MNTEIRVWPYLSIGGAFLLSCASACIMACCKGDSQMVMCVLVLVLVLLFSFGWILVAKIAGIEQGQLQANANEKSSSAEAKQKREELERAEKEIALKREHEIKLAEIRNEGQRGAMVVFCGRCKAFDR